MSFKVVGYLPDWAGPADQVQYRELTHVCYAFALPADANGALRLSSARAAAKLRDVVTRAHADGCQVLISVFGGLNALDLQMVRAAASTQVGRMNIVRSVIGLVSQYDLDGADIDWEYPTGQGDDFAQLMASLRGALPGSKLLTAAVIAGANFAAGLAIQRPVFDVVDWLGIMTYDDNLPGQPHASYDFAVHYAEQWAARGLPRSKLVVGIPFYARPGGRSYASFVSADRANADRDVVDGLGYNGRPTVRRKTAWALANAGGVMFWELSQDTHDDTSLVSAAHEVVGTRADCFDEFFGG
jgi:GH18 family chitinase